MTVERKSRKNKEKVEVEEKAVTVLPPEEPPKPEPTVLEAALAKLNTIEYNLLQAYIGAKKPELAIDMVGKCFISYLNGNETFAYNINGQLWLFRQMFYFLSQWK